MSSWFLLRSGPGNAAFNMALDEALMLAMPEWQTPVLRFYGWTEPAASFGYFQKHSEIERATLLRPLVRRPTGGGLVPHAADWTYSVVIPPSHPWYSVPAPESYSWMHQWIQTALAQLGITTVLAPDRKLELPGQCFVGHEKSDLLWQGRKIAGAAQRRSRAGLLIQGSVQPPPRSIARADWEQAMVLSGRDGQNWSPLVPDAKLRQSAELLVAQKYSQASYNQKR
jgi:lipoate-protein ligase A